MDRIVVGIDGSENSRAALDFAIGEGELRGAVVQAVMAWHRPYTGDTWTVAVPVDIQGMEDSYRAELESIVAGADTGGLAKPVEVVVVESSPAQALLGCSEGADLLVVGSRGHGGFVGLLLGSVGNQVASHAPCPVVIVPGAEQ
jgi:nucleotide-binding universal stress UspA family protein